MNISTYIKEPATYLTSEQYDTIKKILKVAEENILS